MTIKKLNRYTFTFNNKVFNIVVDPCEKLEDIEDILVNEIDDEITNIIVKIMDDIEFFRKKRNDFKIGKLTYEIECDSTTSTITLDDPYQPLDVTYDNINNILHDVVQRLVEIIFKDLRPRVDLSSVFDELFTNV